MSRTNRDPNEHKNMTSQPVNEYFGSIASKYVGNGIFKSQVKQFEEGIWRWWNQTNKQEAEENERSLDVCIKRGGGR